MVPTAQLPQANGLKMNSVSWFSRKENLGKLRLPLMVCKAKIPAKPAIN